MRGRVAQVPLSHRETSELTYSPETVALALHRKRVSDGLSRAALARQIRVTEGTIHNWERGRMPVAAVRVLSYAFDGDNGRDELWRQRALRAEAALKKVTETMSQYRSEVRRDLAEHLNGGGPDE